MKEYSVEKKFVYLALIFGLLFVFLIPPFQSPDEDSHFKKAYVISEGQIAPKIINNTTKYELPVNMFNYINEQLSVMGNRNKKYDYDTYYVSQMLRVDYSEKKYYDFATTSASLISHIIPAIGILFGKIFSYLILAGNGSSPASYLVYFSRMACLITYVTICYFAIKKTPVYKKTMAIFALLPMSLFMGSMTSYDGLLISTVLLLLAK